MMRPSSGIQSQRQRAGLDCGLVGRPFAAAARQRRLPLPLKQVTPQTTLSTTTTAASSSRRDEVRVSFASMPISQQTLSMAFQILDKDEDGRITRSEACKLVAYYLALQQHKPPPAHRRPLMWDQHLLHSINTAHKLSGGRWTGMAAACEAYVGAKLAGGLQAHPLRCSDLAWGALGMATAVLLLGTLAAAAKALPVVGAWHQQGVPLLLGSFGTLAVLLFGKPEAEPVRLWPVIAGQVGATAIVMTMLHVWGAGLVSRAAAMAATVAWMMWSDCIHPPGGALVLMAMDNAAIQQMSWSYLLWPSLALSLLVLLPISAATNWLRRNYQFDAPWSTSPGAATLQQKVQEWRQQQAAKQAAVLRQYRALEIDRGLGRQQALHHELHSPVARLGRVLGPILQLISFPLNKQQQQQKQKHWGSTRPTRSHQQQQQGRSQVRGFNLDLGGLNLGRSISDATPAEAAAAAALNAAIRKAIMREQERRLEDQEHRRHMWGTTAASPSSSLSSPSSPPQLPASVNKIEEEINRLHQQRMQKQEEEQEQEQGQEQEQKQQGPEPQQPLVHGQQQQQQQQPAPGQLEPIRQQQQQQQPQPAESLMSPRQRLEQHWGLAAHLADDGSINSTKRPGAMDSFALEEE